MRSPNYDGPLDSLGWPITDTEGIGHSDPTEDDLPMHRKAGGWARLADGKVYSVSETRAGAALLSNGDDWFLEKGQSITRLFDRDRCPICAEFLCNCTYKQPEQIDMTPIVFSALAGMVNNQDIPAIEFTLTSLRKPASGVSQYGPWTMHSGEISDGDLSHGVLFTIDGGADHLLNKRLHVEAGRDGKGKLCDLVLEEKEYPKGSGKMERKVKIGKRATIKVVDGSQTPTTASVPPSGLPQRTPPQNAPTASYNAKERQSSSSSDVGQRISDYLKVYAQVLEQTEKSGFRIDTPDMKDIATTIYLSYKEGYVWHDPNFGAVSQPTESWKDYVYPAASGKPARKLGDCPEDDLLRYAAWAITKAPATPEQEAAQGALKQMISEKGWDVFVILDSQIASAEGYGDEFDSEDMDEYTKNVYSVLHADLNEEQAKEVLGSLTKMVIPILKDSHKKRAEGDTSIPF